MARTSPFRSRSKAARTIARFWPMQPVHEGRQGDSRAIVLAIMLAALVGWNLNAWLFPAPMSTTPELPVLAVTPDTWAVSREQRRLLEVQEGPPAPVAPVLADRVTQGGPDVVSGRFSLCGVGARVTCVVDGDTFWLQGRKIRIADIDTPEVSSPRCPAELQRGRLATQRLTGLLNAGPFSLEPIARAQDRYGRALLRVTRQGESLGAVLVDERLAVWYGNGRPDWC